MIRLKLIIYLFILWKGVDCIRQKVQSVLDQKLAVWEKYCLYHCFSLPQGFQLPNTLNVCSVPTSCYLLTMLNVASITIHCSRRDIKISDIAAQIEVTYLYLKRLKEMHCRWNVILHRQPITICQDIKQYSYDTVFLVSLF